jgi:ribosomal protein S18 acetylase RimI-like enzyme
VAGQQLTTRFATQDDVPAVAELVELSYRGPLAATGWTNEAGLLETPRSDQEEVAALVADEGSRFLLAEQDGDLVACSLVQRSGENAYFGMFAVDPRRQAAGLGTAVLSASEQAARDLWGSTAMTMSVISVRSELIAWYERRGYARTGQRTPFPFRRHPAVTQDRADFDLVELRKTL